MKLVRFFSVLILLSAATYAGFAYYVLTKIGLETVVFCAASHRVLYIPELACRQYILRFGNKHSEDERNSALAAAIFSAFEGKANDIGRQKALDLIPELLSMGADVNAINNYDGFTPLHGAVLFNDPEQARYLLQIGANPDMRDHTDREQTAWELLDWLEIEQKLDRQEVRRALEEGSRSDAEQNTSHNWSSSAAAAR